MFFLSYYNSMFYRPANGEGSESDIRMTYTEYDIVNIVNE